MSSIRSTVRWSGFETKGMKATRCSLIVPVDVEYEAGTNLLPAEKIDNCDEIVDFPGFQSTLR